MKPYQPVFPARKEKDEGELWLITFGDMMTLLLAFFVLITALSSLSLNHYKEVAEAMAKAMKAKPVPAQAPATPLDEFRQELLRVLAAPELASNLDVRREGRGVVVDIRGGLLFPLAKADLNDSAKPVLTDIGRRLAQARLLVRVEGHTDNLPITSPAYPSNWELSAARAATVARFLIGQGVGPERVSIVGYAETKPLAANESEEGRAKNRRVSLVVSTE